MAAVGQEFWVVAAKATSESEKANYFNKLQAQPALRERCTRFNVPDGDHGLAFGSFDGLIRLTDDLQKCDAQLDSIVHRLERQYIELDPKAVFKIKAQRQEMTFDAYIKAWQWDEARYPKSRPIADNLLFLFQNVTKFDEECRNKTGQLNETKTARAAISKKDGAALISRDLVDVLTPQVVKQSGKASDKFIKTEHLTTVVVILPRGSDQEFLKTYEQKAFCEDCFGKVVPSSAEKFAGLDDKDGNSLWRVVVFRSVADAFKKACRLNKFYARDFEYCEDAYTKLLETRENLEKSMGLQLDRVRGLYQSAWSDTMVAWIHVKAMRVFVESVLRFGMPPSFGAFIIGTKGSNPLVERKAVAAVLGGKDDQGVGQSEDGEEFFSYVSFGFTPFTIARS